MTTPLIAEELESSSVLARHSSDDAKRIIASYRRALGAACAFLDDDVTVEFYRNPHDNHVWRITLDSGRELTPIVNSAVQAQTLIGVVAAAFDQQVTIREPSLQAILPYNGSRFSASIPPMTPGPTWVVRKRISRKVTLGDYISDGSLRPANAERLRRYVTEARNVLVIGPQRSGKTTFANAVLAEVATQFPSARFGIIEDTPELQCPANDRYEMLAIRQLGITFAHLLSLSLRYGAESLSLGELREEASALLETWTTGTSASGVCTIHGGTPAEGLARFEQLLLKEHYPVNREAIRKAIGAIVCIAPLPQGGRRITHVTHITGTNQSGYTLDGTH